MAEQNTLRGLLGYGRDVAQGASNSIAGNVSAPVDGLAWLLRKAGVPMPSNPVGGSDWMRQQGLTAEPQSRTAGLLGDFLGMAGPMVAAAKAPQVTAGLLGMADNAMLPNSLNMQSGMIKTPFGRIPETGKEIDAAHNALVSQLERAGNNINSGSSNVSGSRYLTVLRPDMPDIQIRTSNHADRYASQMPGGEFGERFSIDPASGNTIEMAKKWLTDSGVPMKAAAQPKFSEAEISKWSAIYGSAESGLAALKDAVKRGYKPSS